MSDYPWHSCPCVCQPFHCVQEQDEEIKSFETTKWLSGACQICLVARTLPVSRVPFTRGEGLIWDKDSLGEKGQVSLKRMTG